MKYTSKRHPDSFLCFITFRLETDILFGKKCGFQTVCVLSGVTTESRLEAMLSNKDTDLYPQFIADSVSFVFILLLLLLLPKKENIKNNFVSSSLPNKLLHTTLCVVVVVAAFHLF